MLVEGLGKVTFVNGILRIQTLGVSHDGEIKETGQIEIPGNMVGDVITALSQSATDISSKMGEENNSSNKAESKKKDTEKNKKKKN